MLRRGSLCLFLLLAGSSSALADGPPKGDAAKGGSLAVACQACHVSANPDAQAPRLAGQRPAYLTKQLRAFRAKDRKNDLMNAIAEQLSDEDIANLAAFWSGEAPGSDAKAPPASAAFRLQKMAFPKGFPKGFTQYAETYEDKMVGRSYTNAVAVAAVRAKKPLPDGSVVIVATYKAVMDAKGEPGRLADGAYQVGEAVSFSGMEARAGWGKDVPALLGNGNWGYGLFAADKSPRPEVNQAPCLACHKGKAADSYVFTMQALRDAVAKTTAKPAGR